jgi:hypothetical protein
MSASLSLNLLPLPADRRSPQTPAQMRSSPDGTWLRELEKAQGATLAGIQVVRQGGRGSQQDMQAPANGGAFGETGLMQSATPGPKAAVQVAQLRAGGGGLQTASPTAVASATQSWKSLGWPTQNGSAGVLPPPLQPTSAAGADVSSLQSAPGTTDRSSVPKFAQSNAHVVVRDGCAEVWIRTATMGGSEQAAVLRSLREEMGRAGLKLGGVWINGQSVELSFDRVKIGRAHV